jgi:uncharacterized protein (TIGR03437 family)
MSFILRIGSVVLVLSSLCGFSQPVVSSALNAASYIAPPPTGTTPNPAPIAQGSIFVVFGTGLSGGGLVQASSFPLQTSLNSTSIAVTSNGLASNAFMVYTLPTQLAAILPSNTATGPATLTVTSSGQTSKSINIVVTKAVPGIFTFNSQGFGPGIAQVAFSGTDIRLNNLTTPGTPNSVMILYGTGLGPISGADNTPPGAVSPGGTVTVTVGGKAATVLYAGRAPLFPGEDQINIQLPADVPLGCYTPAVVTVNGVPSNDFTLSTALATGSCVHPFGLSATAEAQLDAGGSVNIGVFAAVGGAAQGFVAEGTGGLFISGNANQVYNALSTILAFFHVTYYPAPTGGCVVYDELSVPSSASPIPQDFTSVGGTELQPAAFLTLTVPVGQPQNIIRAGGPGAGYLWVHLISPQDPAKLGPGTFTLSGGAGPDIAAFTATTSFPANLSWKNMLNLQGPPAAGGVTITWDGGPATGQPNVNIFGNSSVFNGADPSKNRGKSFSCIVDANAKQFVVPASITSQLPLPGAGEVAGGSLGMSIGGGTPFDATLTNGQKLDGSFFGFGEAYVNNGAAFAWK